MAQKVKIDGLAEAVMKELTEYADLATVDMKAAVKKAGNTVKKQIQSTAPKDTGAYSKSWSVKNTKETSKSLEVTVYSRNHYQLAHLLEFGHAKRGGGRVAGRSHIAPAEEAGIKELESEIVSGKWIDYCKSYRRWPFPLPMTTLLKENRQIHHSSATCFREAITSLQMAVSITKSTRFVLNSTVIARTRHWKQHWKLCLMSTAFFITKQRSGLRARSSMKSSTHLKWRFNQHGQ